MTDPVTPPPSDHPKPPALSPHAEALPDSLVTPPAVQQLRDAGFSDAEQAALTTAFLRVLALGTQQATRDDLQTALVAVEQRLTPQFAALREDLRRELAQHTAAVRDALQHAMAQQAEMLATTQAAPARRWEVPPWLLLALLGLTCAGVLLLVVVRVFGW